MREDCGCAGGERVRGVESGVSMLIPNVELKKKLLLIAGAVGFIGSNLVMELLRTISFIHVVGLDNMNDFYDVSIKNTN